MSTLDVLDSGISSLSGDVQALKIQGEERNSILDERLKITMTAAAT